MDADVALLQEAGGYPHDVAPKVDIGPREHWDSPPCDGKYQTVSGVLSKLLTVRSGSEEREPQR